MPSSCRAKKPNWSTLNAVHSQGTKAKSEKRKTKKRYPVVALAESQAIAIREENSGLKKIERIVKGLVKIPPQQIGNEIRIARISHSVAQVSDPGPQHDAGQCQESEKHERLSRQRRPLYFLFPGSGEHSAK